ncbi:MAG: hypothetical protein R3F61_29850 [Myxococcota bacterium]
MVDPVMMFREGGSTMYLLLLWATVFPVAVLLAGGLAAAKVRVPAAAGFGAVGFALAIGLFGAFSGEGLTSSALAHTTLSMKSKMAANGLSVALYPLIAGSAGSALGAALVAAATGAGVVVGAGPRAELTPVHAAPALGVGLAGAGLLCVGAWMGALVGVVAAAGLFLACMRVARDPAAPADTARTAAARAYVTGLGAFALGCAGLCSVALRAVLYLTASANASAEMRSVRMGQALEGAWLQLGGMAVLVALFVVAGLIGTAPVAAALRGGRTLLSTVSTGALGALLLVMLGVVGVRGVLLVGALSDTEGSRQTSLDTAGIRVPSTTDGRDEPLNPGPTLRITESAAIVDGAPLDSGALPQRGLIVETDRDTPLARIGTVFAGAGEVETTWVVTNGRDLVGVTVVVRGEPDQDALELIPSADGWSLVERQGGQRTLTGTVRPDEVQLAFDRVRQLDREGVTWLEVWFGPDATAQDLVDVFAARRSSGERFRVWRIDPLPEVPPEVAARDAEEP